MLELSALSFAYLISLFYRAVIAVIAPELARDLALDESQLGALSSLYFIGFAATQIPVGMALDRFGARLTVSLFMMAAVVGTLLFASADGFAGAATGMALIGIGCAPIFTGSMVVVARKFPADRFAFVTATIITVGGLGDLMSTSPMAQLSSAIGWRGAMIVAAVLTFLSAAACVWLVEAEDKPAVGMKETLTSSFTGMVRVAAIRGLWPLLPLSFLGYAVLMTVRGLWSGPYLSDVYSLEPGARGNVLMAMSIALGVGTFAYGFADRVLGRSKQITAFGSSMVAASLAGLAVLGPQSLTGASTLLIVMGLFGFTYPVLMAHGRSFIPDHLTGRGLSFLTLTNFLGVAAVQAGSGWLMEMHRSGDATASQAYSALFGWLAMLTAGAVAVYLSSKNSGWR